MIKIRQIFVLLGLKEGHERSIKAKKNIIASFIIKGLNIGIGLILVPLTINYLNPTKYGIWITLSSVINWFVFFDIGLGNGLKNKFAEALATGEEEKAKIYISTTYGILTIIITLVFLFFLVINPLIDWTFLLNAPNTLKNELSILALIVFGFFCIKFILQLIGTILIADQKPAYSDLLNLGNNFIALILIMILINTTNGSLLYLGIAISVAPIIIYTMASCYFYKRDYKKFIPSFRYLNFKYAKELMSLSSRFFILQLVGIILFASDNIIITHLFGPKEVTPYNIAFKYFSIVIMIFSIINSPFWSAYIEAYTKNDFNWIKNVIKKIQKFWIILAFFSLLMLLVSRFIYRLWIGNIVDIPFTLSLFMCIYVIMATYGDIFVSFVNSTGKIKLQLIISLFAGLMNIPLSILFAKYFNLGISGVILATIVCLSYGPLLAKIQYKKIINGKAVGIWNE